ncbi:hypothetical protein [Nevskia sp.]|nr:hypothetical protein [Nevskia sp.]
MPDPATPPEAGNPRRNPLPALAAIAAIVAAMALAFAWVGAG